MKLYKGILLPLGATLLLSGCSMEEPFLNGSETQGMLKTSCLAPTLTNTEGNETKTRADVPTTDDFQVVITRNGSRAPEAEYRYADMPEVLTLPVGDYKVYAHHGANKTAAWEEPYYYGESTFAIEENKITDEVDPIVAKLANIRVTIVFHATLASVMSQDSKVEVKVGDTGVMTFTGTETRSAYFRYVNQSQTLAATFSGTVDGDRIIETRTHEDVAPGNHYRITFRMHGIDDDDPGNISGNIIVDTSIEEVNMNQTVDGGGDDPILEDDKRPTQGGGQDPDPGLDPEDPIVTPGSAPQITSAKPEKDSGLVAVDLDKVNEVTSDIYCVLNVTSSADSGITEFKVKIKSEKLNADELMGVGLSDELDLVNPGALEEPLRNLGLPVKVGGMKNVVFDITGFMPLLGVLGEGDHDFELTVGDSNGTSTATLRLHTN